MAMKLIIRETPLGIPEWKLSLISSDTEKEKARPTD